MYKEKGSEPATAIWYGIFAFDCFTGGGTINIDKKSTVPDFSNEKYVIVFWSVRLNLKVLAE